MVAGGRVQVIQAWKDSSISIGIFQSLCEMDNKGMTNAVRNLGKHLRSNCDKILDRTVPFVIDSALFWFVTEAIQSLLSSDATLFPDQSDGFYEYVMFISDFFEQTPTLCITLSDAIKGVNSIPGNLDLIYFRSLEFLELRKIPPHMVASLQSVKSKLRKLKCSRCVGSVCEILHAHSVPGNSSFRSNTQDGPSSTTIMTIWPDLKEVDLSFNRIACIGLEAVESFELAPSVESLNLSRNKIYTIDDSFCKVLNSLRILNLNYNQLKYFPPIPQNVKTLLMSHNYISSLSSSNFQALKNVEVLDLSGNMIADENHLDPLEGLRVLKTLSLVGNPVSFLDNYRFKVCCRLSRYALNRTFILDNKKLSVSEVRRGLEVSKNLKFVPFKVDVEPSPDLDATRATISCLSASTMKSLTQSYDSTSSSLRSSCRKKPKIREPHVYDPDEDPTADSIAEEIKISSSVKSGSSGSDSEKSEIAVVTKNAIQYLRDKYGEENWLLKQSGEEVGKLLGIPINNTVKSPSVILSQSLPTDPIEGMNKSASTSSFYTTAIEFEDSKIFSPQAETSRLGSVFSAAIDREQTKSSHTENTSDEGLVFYPCNATTLTDNSDQIPPSLTTSVSCDVDTLLIPFKDPNTFTDPEGRAVEFGYFQAGQKYKLLILDNYLYELDQLRPEVFAAKWDLKSLETISDEKHNYETDTVEFRITFDTIKKHLRDRTYVMTKSDFTHLEEIISPYLEFRTMQEFAEAFQCLKCNAQFSKGLAEKAVRTDSEGIAKEVPICNNPDCRSHLLVLLDSTPLPNNETFDTGDAMYLSPDDSITGRGSAPKPIADAALFRIPLACSTPTNMHGFEFANTETAGIYEKGMNTLQATNGPSDVLNHRKMSLPDHANTSSNTKSESDVDTLSAHSSSIEVIGAQCDSGSGSDIAEVPEAYEMPTEDSEQKSSKSAGVVHMSDSTSSGSCADSICTTYELTRTDAAYQAHEGSNSSPGRFSTSMNSTTSDSCSSTVTLVSQSLRINSLQRMLSATAPVKYDDETFSTVDHRLQLFCEISVFKGADEKLVALAKVLVISENSQYPAVIIFSNRKMYIYKIVGLEGDKPDSWLQKHHSYALQKIVGLNVLIGRHGVGIDLQGKYYALIFRDSHRTENFLACYLDRISGENELPPLVRDFSQTHKAFLSPESPVVYFGIPHYVECDEEKSQTSGILVTDVEIIFINELMWMGSTRTGSVKASKVQQIANLRQVESLETNNCYVKLIFGSSAHTFWTVYFETASEKNIFTSSLEPYTSKVPFISLSMPIEP